jgi:hypothetical protein
MKQAVKSRNLDKNPLITQQSRYCLVLMKRTASALTLAMALLFSATAGAQLNLLAKANFVLGPANPVITITSPTNSTFNITTLSLEVTFETYKTGYPGGPESDKTRLFTYALDGRNPEPINITNSSVAVNPRGDVFFEGSASLPELTEGQHNLTVRVVFVYDDPAEEYIVGAIHTESESTVYFRINTSVAEPFPTTLVITGSGASIAVVAAGLLVYFKKRKR